MILNLSASQRELWEDLKRTMADNDRLLRLYCAYLRECPRFITSDMMERMCRGDVSQVEAYCALLGAACGLDEDLAKDRRFLREYLYPSVYALKREDYVKDPYYANVRIREKTVDTWKLCRQSYRPFEAFIFRDPIIDRHYRELPQLGFFPEGFSYPAVSEQGVEWMTVTPNEIASMKESIHAAKGRVVTFGLGLGYYAYMVSRKQEVSEVTVVERDPRVIRLFTQQILPQFEAKEKIRIVCADALLYAESEAMKEHDFVFADLWHDVSDGLKLYLALRRSEEKNPGLCWHYWIESSLLGRLRRMVFDQLCRFEEAPDPKGERVESFERIRQLLSDGHLRKLAGQMRLLSQ